TQANTDTGVVKGKLGYLAPEQLTKDVPGDRRIDVYAAGVVLWELLTGERLYGTGTDPTAILDALRLPSRPPSEVRTDLPAALDAVVLRALAKAPRDRYASARQMALAIEAAVPLASATKVGEWVEAVAGGTLEARAATVAEIERLGDASASASASVSTASTS